MRSSLLSLWFFFCAICAFSADTVFFGGMRLNYSGSGYCVVSPYSNCGKWDVWDISVVDDFYPASKASLNITPVDKDPTNFCLRIRSISSPALSSLKIVFPPGGNGVGYLKDLYIGSAVKSISIMGGDLGSNENGDGLVSIKSGVNQFKISGLKRKNKNTGETTYYGGNLFADVYVGGNLDSFLITGGNYSFLPGAARQRLSTFHVKGDMKKFAVKSYLLKDSSGKTSYRGGFVSADLEAASIGAINVAGGGWQNGLVDSASIGKVLITGPASTDAELPCPRSDYGLKNAAIRALKSSSPSYYTNYFIGKCSFRSSNVIDSLISAHGNMRGLSVSADRSGEGGLVSESVVRAGVGYDADFVSPPVIYAYAKTTGVLPAGTNEVFCLPFCVTNLPSDSVSAISLAYCGPAWKAVISNEYGEVFSGFDLWEVSNTDAVQGFLVWDPADADYDFSGTAYHSITNIKLRASYGTRPERHVELTLNIQVFQQQETNAVLKTLIHSPYQTSPVKSFYPGTLTSVTCQKALGSRFSGGILFGSDGSSEHATYLGSLNSFKAGDSASKNKFYSKKPIKLKKDFDLESNEVWIGGSRILLY